MSEGQAPLEDPTSLIKSTIENFQIEPDIVALDRITDNLKSLADKRFDKIEGLRQSLKKLTRSYQDLQSQLEQSEESESRLQIRNQIQSLETNKFEMAKNLTELEFSLNQLNTNLSALNLTYQDLINKNDEIINNDTIENYDSLVLKLNLVKRMGLTLDSSKGKDKIFIYNKGNDSTHVLNVDDEYSSYFISNYLWERI